MPHPPNRDVARMYPPKLVAIAVLAIACAPAASEPDPKPFLTQRSPAVSGNNGAWSDAQRLQSYLPNYPALPAGSPAASDVVFSPRFDRPEAAALATRFGATRIEWTYLTKPDSLKALRAAVPGSAGGTINNNAAIAGQSTAAIDLEGQAIIAPWMRSWGARWNTCAKAEGRSALTQWADRLIAAGFNSIQFDDPGMQFDAEAWGGGDFSPASLEGFKRWLDRQRAAGATLPLTPEQGADYRRHLGEAFGIRSTGDYVSKRATLPTTPVWRSYLRDSVAECVRDLRQHISTRSGGRVLLSMNLAAAYPWASNAFLLPMADHVIAEANSSHAVFGLLYFQRHWLRSIGRAWSPVFVANSKSALRQSIAAAYTVGATPVVPWDVFIPPSGPGEPPSRFFGEPDDFADLYRFARDQRSWLDGWESVSRLDLRMDSRGPAPSQFEVQMERLAKLQVPFRPLVSTPHQMPAPKVAVITERSSMRLQQTGVAPSVGEPTLDSQADEVLVPLSVARMVTAEVRVQVKANPASPHVRVVHVVRIDAGTAVPGTIKLTLNPWVLPSATRFTVHRYVPGGRTPTVTRQVPAADGGLSLEVPDVYEWAMVVIKTD